MMDYLIHLDHQLFHTINQGLKNGFLDLFMPLMRNKWMWLPLYTFSGFFILNNFKKDGWKILLGAVIVIVLSDQMSSSIVKPLFERIRPCNDPYIKASVRTLVACGSGFSFTSSHAANHFAISIFAGLLFFSKSRFLFPILLLWSTIVGFAQVYVGVHYPSDIVGGGILGTVIGISCFFATRYFLSQEFYKSNLDEKLRPVRRRKKKNSIFDPDTESIVSTPE
ncbi:MAG: phosphatase PAP2 family protein [Chitinophagales bacterium]|nr:phosphatase PAP2 family protein [Chitinophagales bacterium]